MVDTALTINLRREMGRRGLNQSQLARDAGLKPDAVRDILRGKKTQPSAEQLNAIAQVLGVAVEALLQPTHGDAPERAGLPPTALPSDLAMVPSFEGIAEMNVIGGLGTGGSAIAEAYTADGNSVSADEVRDIWNLPPSYISGELRLTSKRARIIEVRGDSMEPTLYSGDRVMIDVADRGLAQEGIFALWDGDGVSVKRVERVRPSDPPALRLISDNARHREVELLAEEVQIIGRVVWVARKM